MPLELSEESLAKPVLALVDVSGSVSSEVWERQLLFALDFAAGAGGWVGFFDHAFQEPLHELTAASVASLISEGMPRGGGTVAEAMRQAAEDLPEDRGPIRMLMLSDWCFSMPKTPRSMGMLEGDELFMAGDCAAPGSSDTDENLEGLARVIPLWVRALSSEEVWGFKARMEAGEIEGVMAGGRGASVRKRAL